MLTFDKIRELERNERDTKKLEKLPDDLKEQLREYLDRKENITEKTSAEILELENVKNTIRRFFDLRERKFANMALECVRTGLPPENLTKEEEKVFYDIVDLLKDYRERFFVELRKEKIIMCEQAGIPEKPTESAEKPVCEEKTIDEQEPKQYAYKIKKHIPGFVGPDMKTYEFKEDQTIEIDALPKPLNDLLLKKGVIEKVEI